MPEREELENLFIGTAGWTLPKQVQAEFNPEGTHLQRYASGLNAVEINSSFYRNHRSDTYVKWAQATPQDFRFSVKLWRYFTQERRLTETGGILQETLAGIRGLQDKWAVLLIQLPPSLDFDPAVTKNFLQALRKTYSGPIVWEPRHTSWTSDAALGLLADFAISKVLADPERCRISKEWRKQLESVRYLRLHGTPEVYRSRYEQDTIQRIAQSLKQPLSPAQSTWIIFDNTTFGYATENALELKQMLKVL